MRVEFEGDLGDLFGAGGGFSDFFSQIFGGMGYTREAPVERIAAELLAAVRAHGGGAPQEDDRTVVLVRRDPGSAA